MDIVSSDVRQFSDGATVASGSGGTVVMGPYDLLRWPGRSIQLRNNHASLTLSGAVVQVSNDPLGAEPGASKANPSGPAPLAPRAALWSSYDNTTFISMSAGMTRATTLPGAYRWWRVLVINDRSVNISVSGYGSAVTTN